MSTAPLLPPPTRYVVVRRPASVCRMCLVSQAVILPLTCLGAGLGTLATYFEPCVEERRYHYTLLTATSALFYTVATGLSIVCVHNLRTKHKQAVPRV